MKDVKEAFFFLYFCNANLAAWELAFTGHISTMSGIHRGRSYRRFQHTYSRLSYALSGSPQMSTGFIYATAGRS